MVDVEGGILMRIGPGFRPYDRNNNMGKWQRTKGHTFERKIARRLREIFPEAKRGFQTRGGGKEEADVAGLPFHVECKVGKDIRLDDACVQAIRDSGHAPWWCVVYHFDHTRYNRVRLPLDFLAFLSGATWNPQDYLGTHGVIVDVDFEDFCAILEKSSLVGGAW